MFWSVCIVGYSTAGDDYDKFGMLSHRSPRMQQPYSDQDHQHLLGLVKRPVPKPPPEVAGHPYSYHGSNMHVSNAYGQGLMTNSSLLRPQKLTGRGNDVASLSARGTGVTGAFGLGLQATHISNSTSSHGGNGAYTSRGPGGSLLTGGGGTAGSTTYHGSTLGTTGAFVSGMSSFHKPTMAASTSTYLCSER
jgi:hypothetical protein